MPQRTYISDETARQLFLERAAAYYDELNATIRNAPIGKGFDLAETFAAEHGRELTRQALETIVQQQIDHVEKKTKRDSVSSAKLKRDTEATRKKIE
jgi:hypothetical protein